HGEGAGPECGGEPVRTLRPVEAGHLPPLHEEEEGLLGGSTLECGESLECRVLESAAEPIDRLRRVRYQSASAEVRRYPRRLPGPVGRAAEGDDGSAATGRFTGFGSGPRLRAGAESFPE